MNPIWYMIVGAMLFGAGVFLGACITIGSQPKVKDDEYVGTTDIKLP